MVVVNGLDRLYSFAARKKFGLPNFFGGAWYGVSVYGDDIEMSGVYQERHYNKKRVSVRMRHMFPANPRTEKQQAWRNLFRLGVNTWHDLTDNEKELYNERAKRYHFEGFNLFLREWLNDNRNTDFGVYGVYGVGVYGVGVYGNENV